MADFKFPQILVELVLLLIVGVALGVGAGGFAVADEAGGQGRAVFFAGRGGQTQDGAAERAGFLGQRGQELRVQISALICRQTGDFAPPPAAKSLVGWMSYFASFSRLYCISKVRPSRMAR